MIYRLRLLVRDQIGPTAIEYGLIATLIVVAVIAVFQAVGTNLSDAFHAIGTNIGGGTSS